MLHSVLLISMPNLAELFVIVSIIWGIYIYKGKSLAKASMPTAIILLGIGLICFFVGLNTRLVNEEGNTNTEHQVLFIGVGLLLLGIALLARIFKNKNSSS